MKVLTETQKERIKKQLKAGEQLRVDGRFSYRYTDKNGKRKSIYANDLNSLRQKEKELKKQEALGLVAGAGDSITLNKVFDKYIITKTGLANSTIVNYKYMYDQYVREGFGKRKISSILYTDIYDFYCELYEAGLKPNTLENLQTVLHPTFSLAVRNHYILSNPSDGVIAKVKEDKNWEKPKRRAVSEEEYSLFMEYVKSERQYRHWYELFIILFETGCRISELLGLTWYDIDFEKNEININHQLVYRKDAETGVFNHYITRPKTRNGFRVIPMTSSALEAFKSLKEKEELAGAPDLTLDGYSRFIFYNRVYKFYTINCINRAISNLCLLINASEAEKAKKFGIEARSIEKFTVHQCRHTFCTRLCRNSDNINDIQNIMYIMGHSGIETTIDIYSETTGVDLHKFINSKGSVSRM